MKEISRELAEKDAVICADCGAIFQEVKEIIGIPCPECGAHECSDGKGGLYWILPSHSWFTLNFKGGN